MFIQKYSVQCRKDVITCNTLETIYGSINGVWEGGRLEETPFKFPPLQSKI